MEHEPQSAKQTGKDLLSNGEPEDPPQKLEMAYVVEGTVHA